MTRTRGPARIRCGPWGTVALLGICGMLGLAPWPSRTSGELVAAVLTPGRTLSPTSLILDTTANGTVEVGAGAAGVSAGAAGVSTDPAATSSDPPPPSADVVAPTIDSGSASPVATDPAATASTDPVPAPSTGPTGAVPPCAVTWLSRSKPSMVW